jgi:MerR family transcriptional regulator/heat shock protein HspR
MYDDAPVLTVTAAAQLAGLHPQTLRQYDRLGLVTPRRAIGRGRRYSLRDVAKLREVQRLAQVEGINLAGVRRILDLEEQVAVLTAKLGELLAAQEEQIGARRRVFSAGRAGDVVVMPRGRRAGQDRLHIVAGSATEGRAVVLWRPEP